MTMKRILQCVLVLLVLAMAGCGNSGDSTSPPTNKNANTANTAANHTTAEQSTGTVNPKSPNVNSPDESSQANGRQLGPRSSQSTPNANQNQSTASQNQNDTNQNQNSANQNQNASAQNENSVAQAHNTATQSQNPSNTETERGFLDWLIPALAVLLGVLVLVALVMGVLHLRKQSKRNFENQLAKVAGVQVSASKEGHKELAERLTSLAATQKEISNGLLDLHTEVRSLARLVRESLPDRNDRRTAWPAINYPAQIEDSIKEEPEFPVSADDYLGKMDRFANVVRPDFQNGILVNDPEGTGELMLIRDGRLPDDGQPLFVVPRATQFQTKQDFYTHYAKYYDCVRPTAGSVWILGPAVVEKVTGGWRLREKGMLEIR